MNNDERSVHLMLPAKVLKQNDRILLIYEGIGKPLSTLKMVNERNRGAMIGKLEPRTLWSKQLLSACIALECLHDHGFVSGSFSEAQIHCVDSGAGGRLFTPRLGYFGTMMHSDSPYYKTGKVAR